MDSAVIKFFPRNYRAAKERHAATSQALERMSSSAVCHMLSPTAVTAALQETASTAAKASESPPPAEIICYDKSQPNEAFCQQQLEAVHGFIACAFSISHCYCSVINVFIARSSSLPQIQVVLQPEKTPVWTGEHIPDLKVSLPLCNTE